MPLLRNVNFHKITIPRRGFVPIWPVGNIVTLFAKNLNFQVNNDEMWRWQFYFFGNFSYFGTKQFTVFILMLDNILSLLIFDFLCFVNSGATGLYIINKNYSTVFSAYCSAISGFLLPFFILLKALLLFCPIFYPLCSF